MSQDPIIDNPVGIVIIQGLIPVVLFDVARGVHKENVDAFL